MPQSKKGTTRDSKRGYARISLRKRKMLVRMVEEQGISIASSIKKLKIKLPTARLILFKYRQTGTFPMRKFKKVGKMMLDLPDDLKQEQGQHLIKHQNIDPPFAKEQFYSAKDHDSLSNEEESSQNSSNYLKKQE